MTCCAAQIRWDKGRMMNVVQSYYVDYILRSQYFVVPGVQNMVYEVMGYQSHHGIRIKSLGERTCQMFFYVSRVWRLYCLVVKRYWNFCLFPYQMVFFSNIRNLFPYRVCVYKHDTHINTARPTCRSYKHLFRAGNVPAICSAAVICSVTMPTVPISTP